MFSTLDFNIFTKDYTYQRNVNHVTLPLEERLATMYGAKKVFLTNSCMEAITTLLDYLLPQNGVILVNQDTYYETRQWLKLVNRYRVIELDFQNLDKLKETLENLIKVDVVYLDNPSFFMQFYKMHDIVKMAHEVGAKVIVDNTVLSLYYMFPFKDGVDYVVESYSKYVAGHGDVMAGGIACKESPSAAMEVFIGRRGRCVNALTTYLLERSLETLEIRMKQHTNTGQFISHKLQERNIKHWYSGYGGCIIFPGKGEAFCDALQKKGNFIKCPTFGTTFSTTSFVRSPELYRIKSYARISCGLESKYVLWNDLQEVLL